MLQGLCISAQHRWVHSTLLGQCLVCFKLAWFILSVFIMTFYCRFFKNKVLTYCSISSVSHHCSCKQIILIRIKMILGSLFKIKQRISKLPRNDYSFHHQRGDKEQSATQALPDRDQVCCVSRFIVI